MDMKIKKRLLPMLLSLCLCFGLSALSVRPAYAADLAYEIPGGKLYFDAQTGTITSSDKTVTEADIPAEIYGVPVTAIGEYAFAQRYELTRVTIPDSVTSIGGLAFYECRAMTDVYYGADVLHWSQVKMGSLNDGLDQATIHFSAPVADFKDVFVSDYYADAVEWAAKNKVTLGAGGNSFAPEATVTRAEAVTFLWRAAGSPEPTTHTSPFVDVTDSSAWYYKPILWATEKKITTGVTTTQFGLKTALAYDQMLTFLCRAAGQDANGSGWSDKAVSWAESAGLTDGLTFAAKDACPRSDVVYFLWKQLA